MRNDLYWQDRFVQLKERLLDKGIEHYHNISKQYDKAAANVQKEINNFYQRFADNNQIDLLEAKKLLNAKELKEFKWNVEDYIEKGRTLNYSNEWAKELENASLRYRISRLEAMQLQMQQQVESVMGYEVDELDNMTRKIYEDGYYRTIYEMQKGTGIGSSFAILDTDKIDKVISKPWVSDGSNFSERVWGQHRPALIQRLNTDLVQALIRGDNPQDLTKKIADDFNVAKYKANRLLITEAAFFSEASQKDAFDELGVKYFSICATLDRDTCEDCGDREGEKIPMSMYEVGVTAPPFHPNCRCTTLPEDDIENDIASYRMARDEKGTSYEVPGNMTYKQWKDRHVDSGQDLVKDGPNLHKSKNNDTIKTKDHIEKLEKLQKSGMYDYEYKEYLGIINNHVNPDITRIYKNHADEIKEVKQSSTGAYSPILNTLKFDYPKYADMNQYETLAHEYGHFFDWRVQYSGIHYTEIEEIQEATGLIGNTYFPKKASSSDEFLAALRKDKELIKNKLTPEAKAELIAHNTSSGVQDAIDGLFSNSRLRWGHGERYYNRKFSSLEEMDRWDKRTLKSTTSKVKALQQIYKKHGLDASNKTKTKVICRQYTAASEMWANIMSAEVVGGKELEYVKEWLPNSYETFLEILKGAM